ncbi:conserved hypothetical protein [Sodalis glossinidius str. 'morsitans']|uniref:Neutral zinc metallopeptidase n=1 Tax=Sodalis glossinidius (strain morsitans) TaxID=343509 RepID=Q2NS77_SODGM|nr:conserved hypothetical protein [Sodalis glossinidius str. 'morsitans']
MRWQGGRESNNVEDRHGQSSGLGGGGFRLPIRGKGGIVLLIVVVVAGYYGIDLTPLLTGGQSGSQVSQQTRISPNDDEVTKFTAVIQRYLAADFPADGQNLSAAKAGHVSRCDAYRLRYRSIGHGAVILPGGQYGLYRSLFLRRHEKSAWCRRQFRPGLCGRSRGQSSRAKTAWD